MSRSTKFGKSILLCVILVAGGSMAQGDDWPVHEVFQLVQPRGTYLLDFDKIYETVASLDVETAVSLPPGYTFSLNRQGSIDFINAFVIQNTLFFTRTIDHRISTSIICNVITPSGEVKNLVFKIRGGPNEPVVYAIHFVVEEEEVEVVVCPEVSCAADVEAAVAHRERELNESIYKDVMVGALPAFFNRHRGGMRRQHKGASAYVNGVIYTRNEAFVYIYSNVRRDQCDVVKLLGIRQGRNNMQVDLVTTFENFDGTWAYIYRAPLQPPSRGKRTRIHFLFEIWSKPITYKAIIS